MPIKRAGRRFLRWVVLVVVVAIVVLYIGLPLVMAFAAIAPQTTAPGDPPDGFSELVLTTDDNVLLGAWYAEPDNGAAIILVHGAGSGRGSVRSYAEMLHTNGYGVLAVSMRGYGDSGGQINRLGWTGTQDIGAAVDFLTARDDVAHIGALGLSMGGEILLGAASTFPQINAVVADGATSRGVFDYVDLPMNQPLYRNFSQQVFTFFVRLLSGQNPPETTLVQSIAASEGTSYLFIAAGNVEDEAAFGSLFQDAAPDRSSLWVIPNTGHTAGFAAVPADYEARVIAFFDESLK